MSARTSTRCLGHVAQDGVLHGGIAAADAQSGQGLSAHGIEAFRPYVGRAVVLDVPRLYGVDVLPPGVRDHGPRPLPRGSTRRLRWRPGQAVLIATGWSARVGPVRRVHRDARRRPRAEARTPPAGFASRGVRIVGGETLAFERMAPGLGPAPLPVHRILLVEAGIHIVGTMRLHELLDAGVGECLLMLAPLPIVGATGAPVRPLAVIPE
ncbi:cyclase family protein [Yinghuangia aomiensis]